MVYTKDYIMKNNKCQEREKTKKAKPIFQSYAVEVSICGFREKHEMLVKLNAEKSLCRTSHVNGIDVDSDRKFQGLHGKQDNLRFVSFCGMLRGSAQYVF